MHTKSLKSLEAFGGCHVPSGKLIVTRTREKKNNKKKQKQKNPARRSVPKAQTTAGRLEERERSRPQPCGRFGAPASPAPPPGPLK